MANSVVKVTDSMLNDNLLLLVGEDGTVTPDRETVQTYLNSKSGSTNIQLMHINKNDGKGIDVSIDNLMYMPDGDIGDVTIKNRAPPPELNMEEVARNLYNIRLDHDYTPLTSPKSSPKPTEEDDLAKTLSILEGNADLDTKEVELVKEPKAEVPVVDTVKPVKQDEVLPEKETIDSEDNAQLTPVSRRKARRVSVSKPTKAKGKAKKVEKEEEEDEEMDEEEEEEDMDFEDDDNDSDFELEEELKPKTVTVSKRVSRMRTKSETKPPKSPKSTPKKELKLDIKAAGKTDGKDLKEVKETKEKEEVKAPEVKAPETPTDKKPVKKEKKTPKPMPDDFALFSTPDIIRRVGGKETSQDTSPSKPAKITNENRSKSSSERAHSPTKHNRLSVDAKHPETKPHKKDRRPSTEKSKRPSIDEKPKHHHRTKSTEQMDVNSLESLATPLLMNDETGANVGVDFNAGDQNNLGLDLDQTLLDNLNTDLISEDILYQVAQSLVSNTDLQNVIDKGINEGKLVLDPNLQQSMAIDTPNVVQNTTPQIQESHLIDSSTKGTQIVRSDGRIVTIPPIERPTTRSRNKRKDNEKSSLFKPTHKPLDDEHVSGNELDSSGDEEEESEDDPNKLWCICNQPHNNRFMICCDTCEEWYHGKCVNITKAMGQQMESEGKEWICLFCKDPSLRRPHAAARRVRKASRNSRASTDSLDNPKKSDTPGSVPCVVCQKPARKNSIFCSEACILVQAQTVERTVVFERSTGHMLTGNKAPSAANLDQWLKEHPTYEAVKAGGKVVTSKTGNLTQSKLKLVKNPESEGGVSLAIQNKGVNIGVLKHVPKPVVNVKTPTKLSQFKIVSKHVPANQSNQQQQVKTVKVLPPSSKINIISNTTITPSKAKVINTAVKSVKPPAPAPKEKPMPAKTPKIRQQEQQAPQATKQENIRENVQKTLFEQLTNRLKLAEDLKLTEDEVRSISSEIESQLYKCFGDTGQKYRNKYRSLIFNIKDVKNQTLWRRICEKSINPYELVRLSPDDLASQELAMWREREAKHQLDMIKKSELELLNCNRQYVMKTHKGEQVLEEERRTDIIDNTEVIKSLTEGSTLDGGETKAEKEKEKDKKSVTKHSHKDKERKSSREKDHHRRRSSSRDKDKSRKRSRSRDHTSKKDKKRSRSRDREKHRKSHKSSKYKKEGPIETSKLDPKSKEILDKLVVNKIVPPLEDRLWRHVPQEDIVPAVESDSDHEPSSTVTIPTPPRSSEPDDFQASNNQSSNDKPSVDKDKISEDVVKSPPPKQQSSEIWRGSISMIDVAQISISAHEVSGDCMGLGKELHSNLEIVGRISPDTVWDYITKMKCSNSKTISLVRLTATNMEEKMPYLALYSYLSSRTRLGVVKSTNKAVKDFYILPLAPTKPIPQALLPINGPGFGESRPALLLGIIVRDKRKRPYGEPIMNPLPMIKKSRVETPPLPVPPPAPPAVAAAAAASPAARSYTPPPVKDPRLNKLALPKVPPPANEEDEPYSPEDSDPDSSIVPPIDTSVPPPSIAPFQASKYPKTTIPGLVSPPLPSSTHDLQRQMEELNKKIEMQKSEINSISQNIVTASGSEIGTSALANIALPSNLQQILDSIKTIEAATTPETTETSVAEVPTTTSAPTPSTSDLTIPLMIPKTFSKRMVTPPQPPSIDLTSDTIPLNLPTKPKIKPLSVNSPILEPDKAGSSVLGSLSEEDLIKKAEEMLGDSGETKNKRGSNSTASPQTKRTKIDLTLPPVPGLDDDLI